MNKTKPQQVNVSQVKQFFADAEKRAVAARKNLSIDNETAYQIAHEAMIKGSLALMLNHGQRPRQSSAIILRSSNSRRNNSTAAMQ